MSFAVDSNIWIYALDSKSGLNKEARKFLEKILDTDKICVITWSIIYEVLRVMTHPVIVARPLSWNNIESRLFKFIDDADIRILPETENHYNFLRMVVNNVGGARGNFWHDCHIAATLLEHGIDVIYTRDKDFRKFSILKVIDPLKS